MLHWNYFFAQVEYSLFNPIKQEPLNPQIVLKLSGLAFFKKNCMVYKHSLIFLTLDDRNILKIYKIVNYL